MSGSPSPRHNACNEFLRSSINATDILNPFFSFRGENVTNANGRWLCYHWCVIIGLHELGQVAAWWITTNMCTKKVFTLPETRASAVWKARVKLNCFLVMLQTNSCDADSKGIEYVRATCSNTESHMYAQEYQTWLIEIITKMKRWACPLAPFCRWIQIHDRMANQPPWHCRRIFTQLICSQISSPMGRILLYSCMG